MSITSEDSAARALRKIAWLLRHRATHALDFYDVRELRKLRRRLQA